MGVFVTKSFDFYSLFLHHIEYEHAKIMQGHK
jgi:hypothetical protein